MNRNCNACNIKIDQNIYLKHRTICKNCHNENRRKNKFITLPPNKDNTSYQQPNIENVDSNKDNNPNLSTYENRANVIIGPRNVGKTYYMLKILEKKVTKGLFI